MSLSQEELYEQNILNEDMNTQGNYMQHIAKPARQPQQPQQRQVAKPTRISVRILLKQLSSLNKKIIEFFQRNLNRLNAQGFVFEWVPVYEEEVEFYEEQDITKFPVLIVNNRNIVGVSNIIKYLSNGSGSKFNAHGNNGGPNGNIRGNNGGSNGDMRGNNGGNNSARPTKKEAEEDMKDYFMDELKNDDDERNEGEDAANDISRRAAVMNQARKNGGLHVGGSGSANPEIHENANKKKSTGNKNANNNNGNNNYNDGRGSNSTNNNNNYNPQLSTNTVDLIKQHGSGDIEDDLMTKFWENQELTEMD